MNSREHHPIGNPNGYSPEKRVCREPRLIGAVLNELLPFLRAGQTEQPAERSLTPTLDLSSPKSS